LNLGSKGGASFLSESEDAGRRVVGHFTELQRRWFGTFVIAVAVDLAYLLGAPRNRYLSLAYTLGTVFVDLFAVSLEFLKQISLLLLRLSGTAFRKS
jgi:hypothetical protein